MNTTTNLSTRLLQTGLGLGFILGSATLAQAQNTWTGAVDTIYTKPGNWSLGRVPSSTDDAVIPSAPTRQPSLSAALGIGTARTLTIQAGARLRLNPQSELDLFGDLVNNGSFLGKGSLVVKSPTPAGSTTPTLTSHTIGGNGNLVTNSDLMIMTNAPTTLAAPMTLSRQLFLGSNLTVTSPGALTLLSTPTVTAFVVNSGGIAIGNVTVQRAIDATVNAGVGYRHYSSPVANTTVADLITTGFTPVLTQSYNDSPTPPATVPFPTVYSYNQTRVMLNNTSPVFDRGFVVPASLASSLVPGLGYSVNIGGSQLVDFVGTLNTGNIGPISLTRNADNSANSGVAGYQLLGNPYPSPIDWSRVTTAQLSAADIADGMYVYSSTSQYVGMYRAYANGVGNPVIPMSQAFFVRKASAGTTNTFTFTDFLRVTTSDGTTFQRQAAADVRPQLEMTLHSSDKVMQDVLNVYFQDGTTAGADNKYDAVKMLNDNGMMLNTLTPDGQALAIDGRPLPTDQLTIPLALKVAVSGAYTLSTDKLANMGGLHTYLRDLKTGALTDLAQQPTYTVTLNASNTAPRFELVFSTKTVEATPVALTSQVSLYPSPAKGMAFIELPASLGGEAIKATLIDAMGRTVRTTDLPAKGEATHQFSLSGVGTGIYTLRLNTSVGIVAKRIAVE